MSEEKPEKIKILLVGSRYTGKGQIGRAWGSTSADLDVLQPVILYDRMVDAGSTRVVTWVMSYDPEFKDYRRCFFKESDGIIFTFNPSEDMEISLEKLDEYIAELIEELGTLPPAVLLRVQLDETDVISSLMHKRTEKWLMEHNNMPYFELVYYNQEDFKEKVDNAIITLINLIRTR